MFSPRRKAFRSVIVIASRPLPRSRSARRFSKPRSRFCPPDARVAVRTSGLVATKLEGDKASTNWRVEKTTPGARAPSLPLNWRGGEKNDSPPTRKLPLHNIETAFSLHFCCLNPLYFL